MEFVAKMPANLAMVCSVIAPVFLSFIMKYVSSKKIRTVIGYGVSILIGVIGAFVSGANAQGYLHMIATTTGLGYLAYKKWFRGLEGIEGRGE